MKANGKSIFLLVVTLLEVLGYKCSHADTVIKPLDQASTHYSHKNKNLNLRNSAKPSSTNIKHKVQASNKKDKLTLKESKDLDLHTHIPPINPNSWAYQRYDVSFSGDVSELFNYLKQFDPNLTKLPDLGKKRSFNISFDMENASITDIINAVNDATGDAIKLIYDFKNNAMHLAYSDKVDYGDDALKQSIKWQSGLGTPKPYLTPDGVIMFPYGEAPAVITCKPLNVCDIAFDKAEELLDANIGDGKRWLVGSATSGEGNTTVNHLVIKPLFDNLSTNLVVTSNKGRTYAITLKSSNVGYVTLAGFYYPTQISEAIDKKLNKLKKEITGNDSSSNGILLAHSKNEDEENGNDELPYLNINSNYKITGSHPIWRPINVFNDGVHTYLKLNKDYLNSATDPILVGLDKSGNYQILNYRVKGNYIITDVVFEKAAMFDDIQKKGDAVYITYKDAFKSKSWF